MADWPADPDGDVLRALAERGMDFEATCVIDFTVDFASWPPDPEALDLLRREFAEVLVDDEADPPCVLLQISAPLSHGFVTATQRRVSTLMAPFGGVCDAWGVLT